MTTTKPNTIQIKLKIICHVMDFDCVDKLISELKHVVSKWLQ